MNGISNIVSEISSRAISLAPREGENSTPIPCLSVWRFCGDNVVMPEGSYIYAVLSGSLRLFTPSGIMDYVAGQYSISRIDSPLYGRALSFSERGDFVAAAVAFNAADVLEVALALDEGLAARISADSLSTDEKAAADIGVVNAIGRLFRETDRREGLAFMSAHIVREMIFHALCGSCGRQLLRSVSAVSASGDIYEANDWIKHNYKSAFTVSQLAEAYNMSVSLFHRKFKSAVGMGPLQCRKRLRLTEARRLMFEEGANVTEAAMEVGYESVSQFIRDYRSTFGCAPGEDVSALKNKLKK